MDLVEFYEARGARVIVLSEYGLTDVSTPVHLNRALREHGLLAVRDELGPGVLDPGASAAFAVADHQVAHVYVNDQRRLADVRALLSGLPGVDAVLGPDEKARATASTTRAPAISSRSRSPTRGSRTTTGWTMSARRTTRGRWTSTASPATTRSSCSSIRDLPLPSLTVGWKLAKRAAGFRTLLDVIPLDASLVRGSHGRSGGWDDDGPLIASRSAGLLGADRLTSVDVHDVILRHIFEDR